MSPEAPYPAAVGQLLPRAAEAAGVRRKLAGYSLDHTNEIGAPKARGFQRMLDITVEDIDYLEGAIHTGILTAPIGSMRPNPPWGVNCVVVVPLRGRREKASRVLPLRTVWLLADQITPPQIVNAYLKP